MAPTRYTILVVDDDPDVLDFAEIMLSDAGFAVRTAANGEAALRMLEGGGDEAAPRIDLLFSDVVMPGGMSGFALAVKAQALRPELPVVLTSGYIPAEAAAAISQGHFPLLAKPYRPAQLVAAIHDALGRTRSTAGGDRRT